MKYSNIMNKIIAFFEFLIALIFILGVNSVYSHLTSFRVHISVILILCLFLYICLQMINKNRMYRIENIIDTIKKKYKFIIIYIVYIVIFILLNNISNNNFYTFFVIILPTLILLSMIDKKLITRLFTKMLKIVVSLALISLIFFILLEVLKIFNYTNQVIIDWGNKHSIDSFLLIHFRTQMINIQDTMLPRNTGVFTEAPMYSLVLLLSLASFELLYKKKRIPSSRWILIEAIFTTFSTTGYIGVVALYLMILLKNSVKKITKGKLHFNKYIITATIVFSLAIISFLFINKINTGSGSVRVDDIKACYETWTDNNIFVGAGYGNESSIVKHMSSFRENNKGLSNSFMVILAEGGILLMLVYLIPFVYTVYLSFKNRKYENIIFCVILFYLFLTTFFAQLAIMMLFLSVGYRNIILDLEKANKNKMNH